MDMLIVIFFSYISGSMPFGLILTRLFTDIDIRKIGSGNIGTTNVLRSGNKILAALTLILDSLKGFLPVLVSSHFYPEYIQVSALFAFLGHVYPIWLKFKGGKGVATYLGIVFALSLGLGFLFIFTWCIVSLIFKYSSVSSMFSSLTLLVVTILRENIVKLNSNSLSDNNLSLILFILFIIIIFTHKKNIINLKNKTETKIKL
jgi:acyl phosphate:glycerol-3-phosphate acyltransferase